jgi:hypothetical protein
MGRGRRGVDCAGVVLAARAAATGRVDGFWAYPEDPPPEFVAAALRRQAVRLRDEDAAPGDIAVLRYDGAATHLGILTDGGVVHADRFRGVVVEVPLEALRRLGNVAAFFRFKEV